MSARIPKNLGRAAFKISEVSALDASVAHFSEHFNYDSDDFGKKIFWNTSYILLIQYFFNFSIFGISQANPVEKFNPNLVKHYITKAGLDQLEQHTRWISDDLSDVRFLLWTPENGADNPFEFQAGVDPNELLRQNFDPKRLTKFIAHGWNSDAQGFATPFVRGEQKQVRLWQAMTGYGRLWQAMAGRLR